MYHPFAVINWWKLGKEIDKAQVWACNNGWVQYYEKKTHYSTSLRSLKCNGNENQDRGQR